APRARHRSVRRDRTRAETGRLPRHAATAACLAAPRAGPTCRPDQWPVNRCARSALRSCRPRYSAFTAPRGAHATGGGVRLPGADVDLGDLQLAPAARSRDLDLLAALAAEQRLTDRRLI